MEINDELKDVIIKNRPCYYFEDVIKFEDFDLDNILIDEKLCENIIVYNISYKILIGDNSLRIRTDKIDGFIRVYDGTTYLVLFRTEKNDFSCNRIIRAKSGIAYFISHNYAKIKVDSYDSLAVEKNLTLHNVIILIKSVFNKDKINY